jgi:hypothetical protein
MTWGYRVVEIDTNVHGAYVGIYEVYYDEAGKPISRTENPVGPMGDDLHDLVADFRAMSMALDKPILRDSEIGT